MDLCGSSRQPAADRASLAGTADAEGMSGGVCVDGEAVAAAEDRATQLEGTRCDWRRVVEHEVDVHLGRIGGVRPAWRLAIRMLERERRCGVSPKEVLVELLQR